MVKKNILFIITIVMGASLYAGNTGKVIGGSIAGSFIGSALGNAMTAPRQPQREVVYVESQPRYQSYKSDYSARERELELRERELALREREILQRENASRNRQRPVYNDDFEN